MNLSDLDHASTLRDFKDLAALLPQILKSLPNNQNSSLEKEEMERLYNYDFRDKKTQPMNEDGKLIRPITIEAYNKKFPNLFKIGTFIYAHSPGGIAGQTHLGDGLFVQPCPTRLFEHRLQLDPLLEKTHDSEEMAYKIARFFFINFGLKYMKACFEHASNLCSNDEGTLLILGDRFPSGRNGNFEPYVDFCDLVEVIGNTRKYKWNANAEQLGIKGVKYIYHLDIPGFENQHLESSDIDTLYKIYCESIGTKKSLMIHCTDGLDRAGCFAFTFHLLHNWNSIFKEKTANEITKNIIAEHDKMQLLRGPSFCTLTNNRLHGIVQLTMMMKAVEITSDILSKEPCPDYIQKYFIIDQFFNSPTTTQKLLKQILCERANIESDFFDEFASDIPHPELRLWKIENMLNLDMSFYKDDRAKSTLEEYLAIKNNYIDRGFPKDLDQRYSIECQLLLLFIKLKLLSCAEEENRYIKEKIVEKENGTNKDKFFSMIFIYLELEKRIWIKNIERTLSKKQELNEDFDIIKNKNPSSRKMLFTQIQKLKNIQYQLETPEPTEQAKSKISPRLANSLNSGLTLLRNSGTRTKKRGSIIQIPTAEKYETNP